MIALKAIAACLYTALLMPIFVFGGVLLMLSPVQDHGPLMNIVGVVMVSVGVLMFVRIDLVMNWALYE